MNDSDDPTGCELPDLFGVVVRHWKLVVVTTLISLVLAIVGMIVSGPVYEATAYLEVDDPGEVPTVEAKLKFPSFYRAVTDSEAAARDLARRTRVKNPRGSRILAVIVRYFDPESAAAEANGLAEAFAGDFSSRDESISGDVAEADSPATLAESWRAVTKEFETLSSRYRDQADHPAVIGAKERRDQVAERIRGQLGITDKDVDLGARLKAMIDAAGNRGKPRKNSGDRIGVRLVERATVPRVRADSGARVVFLAGAAVLGAFVGMIFALCGCCVSRKRP